MSKKQVLNEVRRFMKLANLGADLSSNFVSKLEESEHAYKRDEEVMQEEEEEEVEMDMEVEEEPMMGDEEIEMDMDIEVEEEAVITDEEASILIALGKKLASALEADAEEDIEDAMDDLDDADELEDEAEDLEDDAAEDLADAAEDIADETLEEILSDVLGEETTEKDAIEDAEHDLDQGDSRAAEHELEKKTHTEEKDPNWGGNKGDYKRRKNAKGVRKKVGDKKHHYKDYMGEELVQEVLKRVRSRLAAMSKE